MSHQAPNIPGYTIISPLGSGSSGHVWLAKDTYGERRAIKVAHFDYINDTDYQRRFKREVTAQQQLYRVSSHVARIFDYDEKHVPPYIVMDYINGRDLHELIASRDIQDVDLVTRLHWIEAIASTLTKAHYIRIPNASHGILHRDIKPQNIRIQGERPYLLDFSISLTSDVEVDSTQSAMTLRYAAPEMTASELSDIFSFGLVAFEIIYEIHPITTYDEASNIKLADYMDYVKEKLRYVTWRLPSQIDSRFVYINTESIRKKMDLIFRRVLSATPTNRYETPKAFCDDLIESALGSQSNTAFQTYASKLTHAVPEVTILFDEDDEALSANNVGQNTVRFEDSEARLHRQQLHALDADESQERKEHAQPVSNEVAKAKNVETQSGGRGRFVWIIGFMLMAVAGVVLVGVMGGAGDNGEGSIAPTTESAISVADVDTSTPTTTPSPVASEKSSPTFTSTLTSTSVVTNTSTAFATVTATSSPTNTSTRTSTVTTTRTSTATTATSTSSPSPTATNTPTRTPTFTPSATYLPSDTPMPTQTSTPQPWEIDTRLLTINDNATNISVVYVPAGCQQIDNQEVCIDDGGVVDIAPVTNETYDLCLRDAVCSRPAFGNLYDPAGAGANNPVVGVNLAMAQQYCDYRSARLPTAEEWIILMRELPTSYQSVGEWVIASEAREGQSQMYTLSDTGTIQAVWLEEQFLSQDLSFRCVQD